VNITEVEYFEVRCAVADTPLNPRSARPERPTLFIRLRDASGLVAQGEAAPLPGRSREDFAACRRALDPGRLRGITWDDRDPGALLDLAAELVGEHVPAARFALETALLDLEAKRRDVPFDELLARALRVPLVSEPLALSALLVTQDPADLVDAARASVTQGFGTLKLKIGAGDMHADVARVAAVRDAIGPDVKLRVDANRAYSLDQTLSLLAALAESAPELVEEPTGELEGLDSSPVPLALDETLEHDDGLERLQRLAAMLPIAAVVLKPTVLGGFRRTADIARRATQLGLDVIVSHAYEGPLGLTAAAALARVVGSSRRAHGLAAHPGVSRAAPLPLHRGALLVKGSAVGLGFDLWP
jgi:o-succinylbenzoate synthase